ncbi:hypothetical protein ALQ74_103069 [Pseudomonas savastanoi pv. glycinea]|uniref:Uncharacterized protein n=2 Tax=Pseudomonas savastanoi TaxID=29438 RepID=A0A3M3G1P7_PSESG|nr:hypothetical protein ALO55_102996 [Pseudomonas savastanoi pv. phaseolicola]RMM58944.1 hypothetical protein ALQ74_103069 [Pseudomonas savastanoi pv. glycinea]RMM68161.1 hypothetical protein ALQ73_102406 [Pseudomonas savastanoi pv. glycinea]RMQ01783.1 hypothetical protein ALQ12_102961 [Pseudomonas savastanoi pv. glycinea]RMQ58194.1 hypothetical protein ALQ02_102573 [Pseudomonas savastanoi pv. phaseolicola]
MQFSTLCVAKRTRSVQKGMRRGAPHDSYDYRSARSSVGMQFSTLCVAVCVLQRGMPSARKRRYRVRSLSPSSLASSLREPLNTRSAWASFSRPSSCWR